MKVICAWCRKDMGEKEPLEEKIISHGMCEDCRRKVMREKDEFFKHYSEREWEK